MSIAIMNRIKALEDRVEALEADRDRSNQLTDTPAPSIWPSLKRKPGRPRKDETQEVREG